MSSESSTTQLVAERIATARSITLPRHDVEAVLMHIFDTLIAVTSGARLRPGVLARRYASSCRWPGAASAAGVAEPLSAEMAAFTNAMCAHADETDDVDDRTPMHPGASIVPAALALAEETGCSGATLIQAVSCGYDLAHAVGYGAWDSWEAMVHATRTAHGIGQTLGAAAAGAVAAGLDAPRCTYVLSYATQTASGLASFYRDVEHVQKAFASAAMQARGGVAAVNMVRAGFTGVPDILDAKPSLFDAFGTGGSRERLRTALSRGPNARNVDIKSYPVGMPIQAAVQAMEELLESHQPNAEQVERVRCWIHPDKVHVVNRRAMPNINLQHLLALMLVDGRLTFTSAHDYDRLTDPQVRALASRVELLPDEALRQTDVDERGHSSRAARVSVTLKTGQTVQASVPVARGSRLDPISWPQLERKAAAMFVDLPAGDQLVGELADQVRRLEEARDLTATGRLLRGLKCEVAEAA